MKTYVYYNFSKKIFLGTLQFKKYYGNDIFELFYEEGEIITILCGDEIYFTTEEINKILEMKKGIYENNYNCYIDKYKKTFIYNKNNEKHEYDKWLYNINKIFIF